VELPFCPKCLESPVLCGACRAKLDGGTLGGSDLLVSRELHALRRDYPLEDASLDCVVETDSFYALFSRTPSALIGKGGRVVKRLGDKLHKRVKVIDSSAPAEAQLNEFLLPVRVQGVNRVYRSCGETVKIRFSRFDQKRLPVKEAAALAFARKLYAADTELVFE